jgi:DNA-binding transcriptional LysR family regulator
MPQSAFSPKMPSRFRSRSLFAYDDVLIANSSRQLGKLSLEKFFDLSFAVVSLHGEHEGLVDGFVSERGLARRSEMYDRIALERAFSGSKRNPRIAVALPDFLALRSLLEHSHLAAIVPRPFAKSLAHVYPLSMHELPYKTTSVEVSVLWHERNVGDAPQDWLRETLGRASENQHASLIELKSPARSTSATSYQRIAIGA